MRTARQQLNQLVKEREQAFSEKVFHRGQMKYFERREEECQRLIDVLENDS